MCLVDAPQSHIVDLLVWELLVEQSDSLLERIACPCNEGLLRCEEVYVEAIKLLLGSSLSRSIFTLE